MSNDKAIKKEFKAKASKNPEQYYAVNVLKEQGFSRRQCACGTFFWTTTDRTVCGDPACSGGFQFFSNPPAKKKLDYIGVWKEFSTLFQKQGYTPIQRYPIVARWRNDTDFVQASIYDFQPYVVSGEVKPPANPLVVPQFCVRFNDIDNVGITGAHYTGFVMIGQHAFMPPKEFDQQKYFSDIHLWLTQGLGLPNDEITFHEDAWAGGGNFGPCMEYFSRGLELGNQVYMLYEQTPSGPKELSLKVLDMGMGHERNAWFSQGTSTSYETTFPTVCKKLYQSTGIKANETILKKFLPYASYLNVDEVEDIEKTWDLVANKIGEDTKELRQTIQPLAGLYSVAEHTRSLLVALNDGALPSNVGGGYNLRVILRRALGFIDRYGWDIDLCSVAEEHARYLKPLFPELSDNISNVQKILDVEKQKFAQSKQKSRVVVEKIIQQEISPEKLVELYDSQGIAPELIRDEAAQLGKFIKVPDNFYAMVAERHQHVEQEHATKKQEQLPLDEVSHTHADYFEDYSKGTFNASVVKVIGNKVMLDRTLFYPTSGGQIHDLGKLNDLPVLDVFKQGSIIVHVLETDAPFKQGDLVKGSIDMQRRKQLAQHHTATHIVNAAARKVLGPHVNQAGAKKGVDKAHLDITHYESITDEQLKEIELYANRIAQRDLKLNTKFMPRTDAEQQYGIAIYQGGAVPGKDLRIVEIPDVDVECCGGTHLHRTSEVGTIKIVKSMKIQDGICRIVFVAGNAATQEEKDEASIVSQAAALLSCRENQVPSRAQELFTLWKDVVKKKKQVASLALTSTQTYDGDALLKTAEILKTQPEHILKTIQRFKEELGMK